MKRTTTILSSLLLVLLVSTTNAPAEFSGMGQADEYDMFYNDLRPYGEWITLEPGVVVWRPVGTYRDWQPYSVGRWVWTSHGWYWASNEPFGWAVFHYGRWSVHPRLGWIWHPGRVWGPAWVEWRYSDSYIGWAPLPPVAVFHVTFGVRFTRHWVAPVNSWCFVSYSSFGSTIRRDGLLPHDRVQRIIGTTRRGPSATVERDVIVNRGVEREVVERRGSFRAEQYEILSGGRERADGIREGRIETYRPERREADGRSTRNTIERYDTRVTRPTEPAQRRSESREFTRPSQDRREVSPGRQQNEVRQRNVAPNMRSQQGRSSESPASRSQTRSTGRKRDNR